MVAVVEEKICPYLEELWSGSKSRLVDIRVASSLELLNDFSMTLVVRELYLQNTTHSFACNFVT